MWACSFTISLFYIAYRIYGLLGRVPYAAHSAIFIIEEGISYDIFSFILMSIRLFWLSRGGGGSLPAVMMNRQLHHWHLNNVVAKSNHKNILYLNMTVMRAFLYVHQVVRYSILYSSLCLVQIDWKLKLSNSRKNISMFGKIRVRRRKMGFLCVHANESIVTTRTRNT